MKKLAASFLSAILLATLAACGGRDEASQTPGTNMPTEHVEAPPVAAEPQTEAATDPQTAPSETVSETADESAANTAADTTQPSLRVGAAPSGPPTSARFREGTHYHKIVPAQPTSVAPGKVEVAEVFWYACGHCYALDPSLEAWRKKAPNYIEVVRIPAMWNDTLRMHARLFYTAEALGKLDELHSLIFREIHVNNNPLNTVDRIAAFFKQHGVSAKDFQDAFSSFAVESKLKRADTLNRRYRVESVPLLIVNGKYSTSVSSAGSEANLFAIIEEIAAHEHGS